MHFELTCLIINVKMRIIIYLLAGFLSKTSRIRGGRYRSANLGSTGILTHNKTTHVCSRPAIYWYRLILSRTIQKCRNWESRTPLPFQVRRHIFKWLPAKYLLHFIMISFRFFLLLFPALSRSRSCPSSDRKIFCRLRNLLLIKRGRININAVL